MVNAAATSTRDGEVAPALFAVPERDLVNRACRRAEAFIDVLSCDANGNSVASRTQRHPGCEVDHAASIWVLSIKGSNLRDAIQWDTHARAEQGCREVHTRDELRHRVLNLNSRVELEE